MNAEDIARGLSRGQRNWLLVSHIPAGRGSRSFVGKGYMVTQRQLQRKGLVGGSTLTKAGRDVRAILLRDAGER